ncbi:hypothetical protein BGZ76_004551 [Entomortierella beljakovae]|nr:hypothetical protein BGZ76_004551 [Entomortierella beljakovae]
MASIISPFISDATDSLIPNSQKENENTHVEEVETNQTPMCGSKRPKYEIIQIQGELEEPNLGDFLDSRPWYNESPSFGPPFTSITLDTESIGSDDTESVLDPQSAMRPLVQSCDVLRSTSTRQSIKAPELQDSEAYLARFKTLNQDTSWNFGDVNLVEKFHEFKRRNSQEFSFARDDIADLSPGSSFEKSLPSQIRPSISFPEDINIDINEWFPTLSGVFDRVFRTNDFDEISLAVKREDLTDPVAFYLISIIVSYSHYFEFHSELPLDINEREGFIGFTWTFIRGGLTMAKVETRSLEVIITGVEERKNIGRDLRFELKQTGSFADGVAFCGPNQIYLAEASILHNPKSEKQLEDEFKLVRAMRDSWISQVTATCRESIPPRGVTVFGSSSFKDETKIWMMDFKGMFRLFQIDSFVIPQKKKNFGKKLKAAAMSSIELAVRIKLELKKRELETVPASFKQRVELCEALQDIQSTSSTPQKQRKRKLGLFKEI